MGESQQSVILVENLSFSLYMAVFACMKKSFEGDEGTLPPFQGCGFCRMFSGKSGLQIGVQKHFATQKSSSLLTKSQHGGKVL